MLNGSLGLGFVVSARDATQAAWRSVRSGMAAVRQEARQTMDVLSRVARVANNVAAARRGMNGGIGSGNDGGGGGGRYRDANGRLREGNGRFAGGGGGRGLFGGSLFGGGAMAGLGRFLGAGAIIGGLQDMVGAAASFEKEMAAVQAISHASAGDFEKLKKAAFGMFRDGFSPIDAAKGLQDLASAGYNAQDSLKMLKPTMLLAGASMGQLSGDKAAGLLSAALKAFQLDTNQSGDVVNKLVQTMNAFSVQAKDLPLGLANVSRGAIAMNQSLDESLISFGLARNIIPRVESAASAVSRAMERMVDPKVQKALKGIGVEATTSDGKFRNFLDVITDMTPELDKMTDAKRSAFLQKTFGKASLAGLSAVMQQLSKGTTDVNGKFLKGAELVKSLRDSFKDTNGAAQYFKDTMMNTLAGQAQRLKNTGEALAIALGDPIASVFKPLTKRAADSFDSLTEYLTGSTKEVRGLIAGVGIALGLMAAGLLTFGGPVTLVLGGVAAAIYGIKAAIDANVGGIGDSFFAAIDKIKLGVQGALQLFGDGGFSGGVRENLNKAENSGLKNFLVTVFVWVERIRNFFRGVGEGISQGMAIAQPTFDAFGAALDRVLKALGLTSENDPASNVSKWEKWGKTGETVGKAVSGALEWVVGAITKAIEFGEAFFANWDGASTTFNAVKDAATNLATALGLLDPPKPGEEAKSGWKTFGSILGWISDTVLTNMATALRSLSQTLGGVMTHVSGLWDIFAGLMTADFGRVWDGIRKAFAGGVQAILGILGLAVAQVAKAIDLFNEVTPGREKTNYQKRVSKYFQEMHSGLDEFARPGPEERQGTTRTSTPQQEMANMRAQERAAAFAAIGAMGGAPFGGLGALAVGGVAQASPGGRTALPPINLSPRMIVTIDGQQLAAHVQALQLENEHRGGGSDGVPGEF